MDILRILLIILFVRMTIASLNDDDYDDDEVMLESYIDGLQNRDTDTKIEATISLAGSQINCSKAENVKIVQSNSNELYILSKNELFRVYFKVDANTTENLEQLEFLGQLDGIDDFRAVQGFRTIKWKGVLIVVLALDMYYLVYMRPLDIDTGNLVPIQRIGPLDGSSRRIVLVEDGKELYCLLGIAHTELLGKIVLHKWRHSHFTSVDDRNLFAMDDILLFQNTDEILFLIVKYGDNVRKTTIETFNQQLERLQTLYFASNQIRPFIFEGHFYFISCFEQNECFIYQWDSLEKVFKRFQKLASHIQPDKITQFAYRDNFVALQQAGKSIQLFTGPRLSRNASELTQLPFEPTAIYLLQDAQQQKEYLVLVHLIEPQLWIQFLGITNREILGIPTIVDPTEHMPEKIIEKRLERLKDLLLERIENVAIVKSQIDATILLDKDLNLTNHINLKLPGALELDNVQLGKVKVFAKLNISADELMRKVVGLNIRTAELNVELKNRMSKDDTNVIEGDLHVSGSLKTNFANINTIYTQQRFDEVMRKQARDLNSSELPQNLRVHTLRVKSLRVSNKTALLQTVLQKSAVNRIEGEVVVEKLVAHNLDIKNSIINNLNLGTAAWRTQPSKFIYGTKQFPAARFENLTVSLVNEFNFTQILSQVTKNLGQIVNDSEKLKLSTRNITVEDIKVKRVNGLDWSEFHKNLYLKNRDHKINGTLRFIQRGTIKNLNVQKINEILAENLMTLSNDQQVHSNVFIQKFFTRNLTTHGLLNEAIHFKKDVVQIGRENFIETPVEFQRLEVEKSLEIVEEEPFEHLARHIIGTRIEDLTQLYTGKVFINGSLTLQHLHSSEIVNRTKIMVDQRSFNMRIPEQYWMKSISQHFENVQFSHPVKTIHLLTENLNQHPIGQYVFVKPYPHQRTADDHFVSLIFDHAKVNGSIVMDSSLLTHVRKMNSSAVRRKQRTKIMGKIRFVDELVMDHLETENLDQQIVDKLVLRNQSVIHFDGLKTFSDLNVLGPIIVDSDHSDVPPKLALHIINGNNVTSFFQNAVMIDGEVQTINLNHVTFETVNCGSVLASAINGLKFEELLEQMKSIGGGHQVIKSLNVTAGDVVFDHLTVDTINGVNIPDYFALLVIPTSETVQIGGVKRFAEGLTVNDSAQMAKTISSVPVDDWLLHSLLNGDPQTIRGEWKFQSLHTGQVTAKELDGVPVKNLIDRILNQKIDIYSDLYVRILKVNGSLYGDAKIDFKNLANRATLPTGVNWQTLEVKGDVKLPVQPNTNLNLLLTKSVTKQGPPQTISGAVTFQTAPQFEHAVASASLPIHGCDILTIHADALKKHQQQYPQVVMCPKNFVNGLTFNESIQALEFVRAPLVNGVDVLKLNASIVRLGLDLVVEGEKTFAVPPRIEYLYVESNINNVSIDDLVFLHNKRAIPTVEFGNVSVTENLATVSVNNFSLEHLLLNRVRLYSSMLEPTDALLPLYMQQQHQQDVGGYLTFENLIVEGDETRISAINNILIDDVVFEKADYLQDVTGIKEVRGKLTLVGPSAVDLLNGRELSQLYQHSISTIAPKMYFESLELRNNIILEKGLFVAQQINGKAIEKVLHYMPPNDLTTFVPLVPAVTKLIGHCEVLAERPHSKHLLYLDYDSNVTMVEVEEMPASEMRRSIQRDENHSDALALMCRGKGKFETHFDPVRIEDENRFLIRRHHNDGDVLKFRRMSRKYSGRLNVTIENNCEEPATSSVQLQWRSQHLDHAIEYVFQNFTFGHRIRDLRLVEPMDADLQLLVVLFQGVNASLQILGLDVSAATAEWQLLQKIRLFGDDTSIEVAATQNYELLLVAVLNEDGGTIYIYCFDPFSLLFIEIQKIPGRYDLLAFAYIETGTYDDYMLILGQRKNRLLQIYKIDETNVVSTIPQYIMFQTITFEASITKVSTFLIENVQHLAVLLDTGNFFLYKYNFVEGWVRTVSGYYPGINTLIPLRSRDHNYLFISSPESATAISIHLV